MARLSEEKIKQIQEEYAKDPVYSHVAKKCGTTAATVKKYVSGEVPAPAKKKKDADLIYFEDISKRLLEDGLLSRSLLTRLNSPIILNRGLSSPMMNARQ